ncbi:glycosyltransferase family 4 protein [Sphingopyxis panaciterrae]
MAESAMRIIFDVSRLVRRGHLPAPTGIDRVEHEYLDHLLAQGRYDVAFEAFVPPGQWVSLSRTAVLGLAQASRHRWGKGSAPGSLFATLRHFRPIRTAGWGRGAAPTLFLTVSHARAQATAQWRRRADRCGGKLCYFIHDLIPIEYPEYARAKDAEVNRARISSAAAMADGLLVNSDSTARSVTRFRGSHNIPPIATLPFGLTLREPGHRPTDLPERLRGRPYFLVLGTIEPRKNHLLLLKLWREMAHSSDGEAMPLLVLAGRRGWENDNILAMIDRSPALKDVLVELRTPSDAMLHRLMIDARALLAPSFAEGFDLPVAEALAYGCPVLASDIPAHHEVGGTAPLYLHPLDARGWTDAVQDFARPDSALRQRHLQATRAWRPAHWDDHFSRLTKFLEQL